MNHPDFGLTFDTWHFWRAEPDHDLLRTIRAEKIFEVQLADGKSELVGDIFNDLLYHRLLPGDGDFDLKQTVAVLREMGAYKSVGPELFSSAMDEMDANEAGRVAGENLRAWS